MQFYCFRAAVAPVERYSGCSAWDLSSLRPERAREARDRAVENQAAGSRQQDRVRPERAPAAEPRGYVPRGMIQELKESELPD